MTPTTLAPDQFKTLMQRCWDERLKLDYRIWMNDLARNDDDLWQTGERDLEFLLAGVASHQLKSYRCLDLGCGVGRLLRAAAPRVKEIIGVDVSSEAIALARRFTSGFPNVSHLHGNGTDLSSVEDSSVDLVVSYCVLAHVPVVVCVSNLREISRILRNGGIARLQMYVGHCAPFTQTDFLAYRSYQAQNLTNVFNALGLEVSSLRDVPTDLDQEGWLQPKVYDLQKVASAKISTTEDLAKMLYPDGEPRGDNAGGSQASYIIAVEAAVQYLEWGRIEEARHVLSYAIRSYHDPETSVVKLLQALSEG